MKKILKALLKLILFFIVIIGLAFLYLTLTDYKPEIEIEIAKNKNAQDLNKNTFDILSWNIGYAGLGSNMDFFYDGGLQVRTSEERTKENLTAINKFITETDYDFFILQELDIKAKRSYNLNDLDTLKKYKNINYYYAPNYRVKYVPIPLSEPMGDVEAGLVSVSKQSASLSTRFSFPGNYAWPKSLFLLDRCFLVNRYPVKNGKELLIINTHNSAFDDGSLKKQQLNILKEFIEDEYKQGNYIVLGGDWNQNPPNLEKENFGEYKENSNFILSSIDKNIFSEDWKFAFDNNNPTNRALTAPYKEGETPVTILDFFLLSPNIKMLKIETINKNFENSDHNPVHLQFKLK
jgi:endonuclease/exonuclease/phosphatase family metal-dependent hydrolase